MTDRVYVDTNILLSVFAKTEDPIKTKEHLEMYEDNKRRFDTLKMSGLVMTEFYHVLLKKMSKKLCIKLEIRNQNINTLLKIEKFLGLYHSIVVLIFEEISKEVKIEFNYMDMIENIYKFKISSMDYAIYKDAGLEILTADGDFDKFLKSESIKNIK